MERNLKYQLKEYFEAPEPESKKEFIRKLERQPMSMGTMIRIQICYISKYVWVLSAVLFMAAVFLNRYVEEKYIGSVYAMIPLLVMLAVTESMRSYRFGMYELETSSRFSLKAVILTRMLILGIGNLAIILVVALVGRQNVFSQIIYMLVPYMITAAGGLMIARRMADKEGTFICMAFSMFVAVLTAALPWQFDTIYSQDYIGMWIIAGILCTLLIVREVKRTIRMTEDLAWN